MLIQYVKSEKKNFPQKVLTNVTVFKGTVALDSNPKFFFTFDLVFKELFTRVFLQEFPDNNTTRLDNFQVLFPRDFIISR